MKTLTTVRVAVLLIIAAFCVASGDTLPLWAAAVAAWWMTLEDHMANNRRERP